MLPPPFRDFGGSGKLYGTQEIDSFIELELLSGGKARPSLANEAGDIIMEGGSLHGLSLDPLGPTHKMANTISSKPNPNQFFTNVWLGNMADKKGFLGSIQTHFEKIYLPKPNKPPLNKVVIDYKYFQEISISIGESPNYFKNYIDNIIITHFSEYNNNTYLVAP